MSIINRYLTVEIFKYFGIVLAAVISIYVAVDFFEKIDNFMEAGLPLSKVFSFFLLKIPFVILQTTPVCILLAVLVVFGLMTRNNEIVALKSSGVSAYYLLRPTLLIGFMLGILLFFLSEAVVPITVKEANKIWLSKVEKESAIVSRGKNIWIKDNRSIIYIKHYSPTTETIFGVTINSFDEDFRLIRRIDAKKGLFKQDRWLLHEILEQNFMNDEGAGEHRVMLHEEMVERLGFSPEDLKRVVKRSEEMNFKELLEYIRRIEAEGYDATSYRVDLYAKVAFPSVCVIMCMVGTGIAVRKRIKDSLPVNIAHGIGIAFIYWIFYSFCVSLGHGGTLHPFIAAWAANLVFFCFGVFTLLDAE